jgi:polyhydroxyalkanoate synthase
MSDPRRLDDDLTLQARSAAARLDRTWRVQVAGLNGGLSPVALALAGADWLLNLASSPATATWLMVRAHQHGVDAWRRVRPASAGSDAGALAEPSAGKVLRWPDWADTVHAAWSEAHRAWTDWLGEAAALPGMTPHHVDMVGFFGRQWLDVFSPACTLLNPEVRRALVDSRGASLMQGWLHWQSDVQQRQRVLALGRPGAGPHRSPAEPAPPSLPDEAASPPTLAGGATRHLVPPAGAGQVDRSGAAPPAGEAAVAWRPGQEVAVTPGAVVYRNHLIELIQYAPATAEVQAEPVLIVPSWIMKYYILDLSPHNSMVRWLVEHGHTVFILSWRNPDADDAHLGLDDYLHMGIFDALAAVAKIVPGEAVHAVGYCLGGTLLAAAAAALARPPLADFELAADGPQDASSGVAHAGLAPLQTVTLLAAQVDFTEPGEIGVLIDEAQVEWLEDQMAEQGYLSGRQMAGSFQFLHARELVWSRAVREYFLGVREHPNDLMAWNADLTRMPARMHSEYLHQLFLRNELAQGRFEVDGRAVLLRDLRLPMFAVGTEKDHVSPWPSVYKLHRLVEAPVTFVLACGGHNAGIVSEPGHPRRSYRVKTTSPEQAWAPPAEWRASAELRDGSWWPCWQAWLAAHGTRRAVPARPVDPDAALGPAPGTYVRMCYPD